MRKLLRTTIILAATALLLTGCAGRSGSPATPEQSETNSSTNLMKPGVVRSLVVPTEAAQKYCPQVDAVHLNETDISLLTKEKKTAYVCRELQTFAPVEQTSTAEVQIVSGNLMQLLEAYSAPNAEMDPATTCIAMVADPLIVNIVTAAGIVPVYAPVDVCGFPQEAAATAYNNLTFEGLPAETDVSVETPTNEETAAAPSM